MTLWKGREPKMKMEVIKPNGGYFELDHLRQLFILDDNIMIECDNGIKTILSSHEYKAITLERGNNGKD